MISVIIPTLNEEKTLPSLLLTLVQEDTDKEIIVVDGGSRDSSIRLAQDYGAKVLLSLPGRGAAINRGASEARGDLLLFLHADIRFPAGGLKKIKETLVGQPNLIGGNFRLLFDGDTIFSRWLTGFYAWIRWCGLYYGDSGIFVRRSVYNAIGGIRPIPIMEDIDFVRRGLGKQFVLLIPHNNILTPLPRAPSTGNCLWLDQVPCPVLFRSIFGAAGTNLCDTSTSGIY